MDSLIVPKMNQLNQYLTFGLRKVEGWLDSYSAKFIGALSEMQLHAEITGAVGEVGVHHGKLLIVLLLTASKTERAFAIDVFERQDLNTDGSGCGNKETLLANLRRWTGTDKNVSFISQSSLQTHPDDILGACGRVRLASIDGGHTEECTLNDLVLMENVLSDRGIVIIDDYFNQHWPDVSTGAAKYLASPRSTLRPFAISPNKVYLTAPENGPFYRNEIRKQFLPDKESVMFGAEVDIYGVRQPKQTLAWFAKERLKQSVIGPYLLAAKMCVLGK